MLYLYIYVFVHSTFLKNVYIGCLYQMLYIFWYVCLLPPGYFFYKYAV